MVKRNNARSGSTGTKKVSSKDTKRVQDRSGRAYDVPTNPDGTIPIEYLEKRSMEGHKNLSGWMKDLGRSNKTTYPITAPPEQMLPWIKDPARYDVEGIDALPGADVKPVRKVKDQSAGKKKAPAAKKDPSSKKAVPVKKDADIPKEVADEVIKGIQDTAALVDFRKELDEAERNYLKEKAAEQQYPTDSDLGLMSLIVRMLQDTDSYEGTSMDVLSRYLIETGWSPQAIEKALDYLMDTGHMYETTLAHYKLIDVPPFVTPVLASAKYHAYIAGLNPLPPRRAPADEVKPKKAAKAAPVPKKKKADQPMELGLIKGSRIKDLAQLFPCIEAPVNTDDMGMISPDHTTYVYCHLFVQPGRSLFNLPVDNDHPLFVDVYELAGKVAAADTYQCTIEGEDLCLVDTATGKEIRAILTTSPNAQRAVIIDRVKKKSTLDQSFDVDGKRLLTGVKRAEVVNDSDVAVRVKGGQADLLSMDSEDPEHMDLFGKQKLVDVHDSECDACSGFPVKNMKFAVKPLAKGPVNIELGTDMPILINGECRDLAVHTIISPRDDPINGVAYGTRMLAYDKKKKGLFSKLRRKKK